MSLLCSHGGFLNRTAVDLGGVLIHRPATGPLQTGGSGGQGVRAVRAVKQGRQGGRPGRPGIAGWQGGLGCIHGLSRQRGQARRVQGSRQGWPARVVNCNPSTCLIKPPFLKILFSPEARRKTTFHYGGFGMDITPPHISSNFLGGLAKSDRRPFLCLRTCNFDL